MGLAPWPHQGALLPLNSLGCFAPLTIYTWHLELKFVLKSPTDYWTIALGWHINNGHITDQDRILQTCNMTMVDLINDTGVGNSFSAYDIQIIAN